MKKSRMSCDERKECILDRVRQVFSQKGFDGTTTRELAKAAGISEGLLFKHFPSKEALHRAMLSSCVGQFMSEMEKIMSLKPSTETLVQAIRFLASAFLTSRATPERDAMIRLFLRNVTEDGEFARFAIKEPKSILIPQLEELIKASIASGDIADSPVPTHLRAWSADRLAFQVMTDFLPATPLIDYGVPKEKLADHLAWFILRGIGLKEEAIRRYYTAKTPVAAKA